MSFAGAVGRIVRTYRDIGARLRGAPWLVVRILIGIALAVVLLIWWAIVLGWYLIWGLWLVPYRLIRRGSRKRKLQARQHRELLDAIERQKGPTG